MAGLRPGHPRLAAELASKTWMPGTSPGMTTWKHCARLTEAGTIGKSYVAFLANVALRLSNNSTFTPLRRMMKLCWSTESVLFQAQ